MFLSPLVGLDAAAKRHITHILASLHELEVVLKCRSSRINPAETSFGLLSLIRTFCFLKSIFPKLKLWKNVVAVLRMTEDRIGLVHIKTVDQFEIVHFKIKLSVPKPSLIPALCFVHICNLFVSLQCCKITYYDNHGSIIRADLFGSTLPQTHYWLKSF